MMSSRPEDWDEPSGLRIGSTEMTRYGMKEQEMKYIADLIVSLLEKKESAEQVKKKVVAFRRSFNKTHYCFEE